MPQKIYKQAIKSKQLDPDRAQRYVVERLEALEKRLKSGLSEAHQPSLLSKLLMHFKKPHLSDSAVKGAYIWGSVGRGKTHLMDMFYECLPMKQKIRLHFHRFMQEVHHQLASIKDHENPLSIVADNFRSRASVICLDELFVSDIGDAMILSGLLEALFERGISLVATSNCHPDDLYKDGLQRQKFLPAIDLIKQHTDIVELRGDTDHRLSFLESADIYHFPLDQEADDIMLDNFLNVSHEPGIEGEILTIEDRKIKTVRCSEGVVWFEFSELCGGPRSAADYIKIARCFNTVLISNIPVLSQKDDLAKRFIIAIDEFYDRNVKVIISADADAHELYAGQKLSFEFQRTVSRLIEMRSYHYLGQAHKSL
ncbi:MAG: cell division protein ZapE [Pseudomonadota bacterium]